jgi:hypothetical protein
MVHYSMLHLYWRIRIPTPPASSKSLPPSRKAARPIRLQGERSGAAEDQLGDLLSGDGGQENAMAEVASSKYEIIQLTMT